MDIAQRAFVISCPHCDPTFDWIQNTEGKAPQVAYTGFPVNGAMVLSKKTVQIFCEKCALQGASGEHGRVIC